MEGKENMDIPDVMKSVVLTAYHEDMSTALRELLVDARPTPVARRGQVLIRMAAAPCNQSDLLFIRGRYGVRKPLPAVPGWEGSGRVVASGGGWLASALVGKRVACGGQSKRDGTWAEYYVADAAQCVPLPDDISLEAGASFLVNPLTALGLLDRVRKRRAKAAIQTAAMSQLGQMMIRLFETERIPLVSIVRREEQCAQAMRMGARCALNAAAPEFNDALADAIQRLGATVAFDAVGGPMSGRLLNAMPPGSEVVVYGALSDLPVEGIDPIGLIFQDKQVTGFYLGDWLREGGILRTLQRTRQVARSMRDGQLTTSYAHRIPLERVSSGLAAYVRDFSGGKGLLLCDASLGDGSESFA
jgi:NADPH:quinone reductase-like Zn-dependent oxidoreductase